MHHACITDRREVLTSPLCHQLSSSTQLKIKMFLEKIDNDISVEQLVEVIKECSERTNELILTSPCVSVAHGDDLARDSPLQDLLCRTPQSKPSRFLEKDREINKLKTELELERYEKADLQEELKAQCEKNNKLGIYGILIFLVVWVFIFL